jgi:dienelactone hydrolase
MKQENSSTSDGATKPGHYAPFGWEHWPDYPMWSYQFRRGLGETQEGGGAVSETFQAASRMTPGDNESWHREYMRIADRNFERGNEAEAAGHVQTAMNNWLRAADYYRQAEFWLKHDDPRRLATFEKGEASTRRFLAWLSPPGEAVEIPYEKGVSLCGYFIRSPHARGKQPTLVCFGGLDSHKDELWFMVGRGAIQRGMSVLMVDGPGQGGTLRRHGVRTRYDYEVPVGRCIDYLETRDDVDLTRTALSGSSLGGYYSARAASFEPRIAACISHGAIWDIGDRYSKRDDAHPLSEHARWVFGGKTMKEVAEIAKPYKLEGILGGMKCPYLIIHGGHDVLGVADSKRVYDEAKRSGVDVTLRLTSADETGADHCQHDNPTLGQELMIDWLADRFNINQRNLG